MAARGPAWGAEVADRSVALFCFFPGSFVLSMLYAEPLMLALGIGCLLALHDRRWLAAGLLAGLATATRPNAVALVVACAWAAVAAVVRERQWRALVAPFLAPSGLLAFHAFLWARTGDLDAWARVQHDLWAERVDLLAPFHNLADFVRHPFDDTNITLAVVGTVFVVAALGLLVRARPPAPVLVYTVAVVILMLVSRTLGPRPRFVLTAFPLVVALGRTRGVAFSALLGGSAVLLGALTVLSVTSRLATP